MTSDRPASRYLHFASLVCAAVVIVIGTGTVVSWQFLGGPEDPFENRLVDGTVAAAFVACGLALLLLKAGAPRLAAVIGGSVSLLTLLVFVNDVLGLDLGVDPAALERLASARSIAFVSIAPTTLMAFVLAGLAIAVLGADARYGFVGALLGTLVATLALAAIINGGVSALTLEWLSYFRTEPVTAAGLLVLGIGLAAAGLDHADPAAEPAGWAVPLAIGTTTLLVGLLLWNGLRLHELRQLERILDDRAATLTVSIRNNLQLLTGYLSAVPYEAVGAAGAGGDPDPATFVRPASANFPGLSEASWIDVRSAADPTSDFFDAIPQLQFLEGRYEALTTAEGPFVSGPLTREDGEVVFQILLRRELDEQSRAFLSGMIVASAIFSAVPQLGGEAFDVMVLSDGQPVLRHGEIGPDNRPPWGRTLGLDLPGPTTWELVVAPRYRLLQAGRSVLPEFVLGASLLIAVLLTALTRTAAQARHRGAVLHGQGHEGGAHPAEARVDGLVATMSHEIRNPVAVIRNVVDLLEVKKTDAGERERLQRVLQRQSNRILDIMNALIDLQLGRGSVALVEMQNVNLTQLLRAVVDELGAGIEPDSPFPIQLRAEDEGAVVKADRPRLRRAFRGVIEYAVRNTPAGERVDVIVERTADEARVTIRDRGSELPADEREDLFYPFSGTPMTSPRTMEGTMMLSAARRILEFHGGGVRVRPAEGGGLEFHISLPVT